MFYNDKNDLGVIFYKASVPVFPIDFPQPGTSIHDLKDHFNFHVPLKDITISLIYCYCIHCFPAFCQAQFNFSTSHCDAEKSIVMVFFCLFEDIPYCNIALLHIIVPVIFENFDIV